MLLLLVQNHQPQIFTGSKNRRPGSHHDPGVPPAHTFPFVQPFPDGQGAVQHRDPGTVAEAEQVHHLRRQRYFRHQHDNLPPVLHHLVDEIHIHLRFATSCDAVEEGNRRTMLPV